MIASVKIAGLGRYLPERVVSNSEVEQRCGLPTGWIKQRTGVLERRWVWQESNAFMAAQAAQEAIENAELTATDIDLIINASGTQQQSIPDGGPLLQRELGLGSSGIPSFTVHATCLSFLVALEVAANFLVTGRYRNILISSAEIASRGINFKEPESAALLGDAAAAAVVTQTPDDGAAAIHAFHFETYGKGADLAEVRGGGTRKHPNQPYTTADDNLFSMNGPQLLKLTHQHSADFLERLQPGLSRGLGGIQQVIPHQASMLGLRLLNRFGWPQEKVAISLDTLGNTVAASIPVTLYQTVQNKQVQRGDKILLIGTGAGLSLGGAILAY